jgi:DNA-binding beta-propeller fold protein YncE
MKNHSQLLLKKSSNATLLALRASMIAVVISLVTVFGVASDNSQAVKYKAPAGTLPATLHVPVGGYDGAVLPNGRFVTPVGTEFAVGAPKPFGMAVSADGTAFATVNSGIDPFSVTLVTGLKSNSPQTTLIALDSTFLGIVFSPDSSRFYVGGGEDGNIWVGDTALAKVIGSVNLNTPSHPTGGMSPANGPVTRFKGTFPGRIAITSDGRYLYVTDQGGFQVLVVDTTKIVAGIDSQGNLLEPDNFAATVGSVKVGRYPFGIALSPDNRRLYVTNVGVFQYASLRPSSPVGNNNIDFPLCYPGAGYPDETANDRQITIHKVDPRNLTPALSFPDGIGCGYIQQDQTFTVPGLGSPNAPESSSVSVIDISSPTQPSVLATVKTGPRVGDVQEGIRTYAGSHPNAVLIGHRNVYVVNGSDDTVSILSNRSNRELQRISLSVFGGVDHHLKGVQPVSLALSPDQRTLYVAEAGINAVAVVRLPEDGHGHAEVRGLIPTGWWPSSVAVSKDGGTLYVASANGRGALPNDDVAPNNLGSPKSSTLGTVNILSTPSRKQLADYTQRVLANNGFVRSRVPSDPNPIPSEPAVASQQIKHVIFINKENATHDLLLGDITQTRKAQPVNGDPDFSLGYAASPNHHELALQFTFSDNFFLEPSVSSDGHRWLNNNFTTEFEQTHWAASYGGRRNDAGDDPNVFVPYPGRLGFTDANSSPEPNDYDEHGGIFAHLARNGKDFINFGNGYEFAIVDEDNATEPTGIRHHVNVPMEKILRDHSDHFYPEFNTHIPDGILPEDPTRFSRFGRFRQVFESRFVDREDNVCKLPSYVDLYYPNDHGGGPRDINPNGPDWSFVRFVQDNDAALGETVDLISHSPCWKDTVIFAVEDDPQNGLDHVNGTRSIFIAVSPWIKRQYLSKNHYSLASIFKTVNLILGIPPLNQYDAAATDLRDLFTLTPDFTPYSLAPIQFAATANPAWTALTQNLDFSKPDENEVELRRAIQLSEGIPHRKPGKQ